MSTVNTFHPKSRWSASPLECFTHTKFLSRRAITFTHPATLAPIYTHLSLSLSLSLFLTHTHSTLCLWSLHSDESISEICDNQVFLEKPNLKVPFKIVISCTVSQTHWEWGNRDLSFSILLSKYSIIITLYVRL